MRLTFPTFASLLLPPILPAPAFAASPAPAATLSISAPSTQPSGVPVVLTLTIQNTGPGDFPDARDFTISIQSIGASGISANSIKLSNGQQSDGVGRLHPIAPGEVVRLPAACPALPVGKYSISASCNSYGHLEDNILRNIIWPAQQTLRSVEIEIHDDPALREQQEQQLLAKVRAADPFARYLSAAFARPTVRAALSEDLMSPNVITVERAMDGLWGDGPPSEFEALLVRKALQKHIQPPEDGIDFAMMGRLIYAASNDNTAPTLELLARAAAARPDGRVHDMAMRTITQMRYPPAIKRRPPALPAIPPEQYDPEAIAALLKLARSLGSPERKLAYLLLANYPQSPEAAAAIKQGTADPDPDVQATAQHALLSMSP